MIVVTISSDTDVRRTGRSAPAQHAMRSEEEEGTKTVMTPIYSKIISIFTSDTKETTWCRVDKRYCDISTTLSLYRTVTKSIKRMIISSRKTNNPSNYLCGQIVNITTEETKTYLM